MLAHEKCNIVIRLIRTVYRGHFVPTYPFIHAALEKKMLKAIFLDENIIASHLIRFLKTFP